MAEISATSTSYIASAVSFLEREGGILRKFLPTKSGMKFIRSFTLNDNIRTGEKSWVKLDFGTKFFETVFDGCEVVDRVIKFAKHLPLIVTGQEGVPDLIYDGLDFIVTTISAANGATASDAKSWGCTVTEPTKKYLALTKMGTMALWKGKTVVMAKWNIQMDPVKRLRDVLVVIILVQSFGTCFFNCFREENEAHLKDYKKAVEKNKQECSNGLERLLFYGDPVKPIKHDSVVRWLAPIESIFCNSYMKRLIGTSLAVASFAAHRNACLVAPAA